MDRLGKRKRQSVGVQSYDPNITPFLKDSNPFESGFVRFQSLTFAVRLPKVLASQCLRNAPGLVFKRWVSLPTASAVQ